MGRIVFVVAVFLAACSSDDGGRMGSGPDVTANGGGGTDAAGGGGTVAPWPDPTLAGSGGSSGAGGTTPGGGAGGTAPVIGVPVAGVTFDAGSDPARNNVQPGTICARLAEIQCAGEEYCCENPGRDRATCQAAQMAACSDEAFIDVAASDEATGYDAAHNAVAFAELERLAMNCDASVAAWGATPDGLIGIYKGTRGPGADCSPTGVIPGRDDAAIALASCTPIDSVACIPETNAALGAWSCANKSPGGGPCLTDLNCVLGLYCDNPALSGGGFGLGTCQTRLPPGLPCAAGNECDSLYCIGGTCGELDSQNAYCLTTQL